MTAVGFRRDQKTLKLTFEGELEGLEVKVRRASPEMMRHVIAVAENAKTGGAMEEQAGRVLDLCEAFGKLLDSWNYEDEQGQPIPATAETLAGEDVSFVFALTYGWLDAVAARVEQMTAATEPAGDAVAEAALPMEVNS